MLFSRATKIKSLEGIALGDAWGYPWEFKNDPLEPTPLLRTDAGYLLISDDTQMTLAAIAGLRKLDMPLTVEGFERAMTEEFVHYALDVDNNRAPGATVMTALFATHEAGDGPSWQENASRTSDGCGSVMRAFPTIMCDQEDMRLGMTIRQGQLTHNSAGAIAATAVLAIAVLSYHEGLCENLIDAAVAAGESTLWDLDVFLSEDEKEEVKKAIADGAIVRFRNGQPDASLLEILQRCYGLLDYCNDVLDDGGIEQLAFDSTVVEALGTSFDAMSAVATSLLISELVRSRPDFDSTDALRLAVQWLGDRDSRAAIVGGIVGALFDPTWEILMNHQFEPRYDAAIRTYEWNGFKNWPPTESWM